MVLIERSVCRPLGSDDPSHSNTPRAPEAAGGSGNARKLPGRGSEVDNLQKAGWVCRPPVNRNSAEI